MGLSSTASFEESISVVMRSC